MNILVTGALGQLGMALRREAQDSPHRFVFTDKAELDITCTSHIERVLDQEAIELIINAAAYTQVDRAEDDPEACFLLNQEAPRLLAEAALARDITLIHISTDYVFSGEDPLPLNEEDWPNPHSVYGLSKLRGEDAIRASGCRHIIIRTAWLYSTVGHNFLKTILRLTAERPSLQVVIDQIGTPTYAQDLAHAILHIIETDQLDKEGLYHFSNQGVCSWYDFAHAIAELAGHSTCSIHPCLNSEYPTKAKRPHYSVLDKSKFTSTFGLHPRHWREALEACMAELSHPTTPSELC